MKMKKGIMVLSMLAVGLVSPSAHGMCKPGYCGTTGLHANGLQTKKWFVEKSISEIQGILKDLVATQNYTKEQLKSHYNTLSKELSKMASIDYESFHHFLLELVLILKLVQEDRLSKTADRIREIAQDTVHEMNKTIGKLNKEIEDQKIIMRNFT